MLIVRLSKIKNVNSGYYDNRDEDTGYAVGTSLEGADRPEEVTPQAVHVEAIKSYYPRRNGRVGTRINFIGGIGFAVRETVAELESLLVNAGVTIVGTYPEVTPQAPEQTGEQHVN